MGRPSPHTNRLKRSTALLDAMHAPSPADSRGASDTCVAERGVTPRLAYGMTRLESRREKIKTPLPDTV